MKLCTKNYENPSIFVKVTAKKSVAPFFSGHGVYDIRYMLTHHRATLRQPWWSLQSVSVLVSFVYEGSITQDAADVRHRLTAGVFHSCTD